jgi:hypothetical protein
MFPKKGNILPKGNGADKTPIEYAEAVAAALRRELGDTHRAVKTVMRWTRASERTAKNWLSGEMGPNGHYLVQLMRESDAILHAILLAAGRVDVLTAIGVNVTNGSDFDETENTTKSPCQAHHAPWTQASGPHNLPSDPVNDPLNDPDDDPVQPPWHAALNQRQRWFLEELAKGVATKSVDIMRRWGIAQKTAKRDISVLKGFRLVEFSGSSKTGTYRLVGQ